jgi:protein involved in polysaccharide export with SLBB domain
MKTFSLLLATLVLCSCGTMKRAVNAIPVPSMAGMKKLVPSMKGVAKMMPKLSADDRVDGDDPLNHFEPSRTLGYGGTLRLRIFQGVRENDEIYSDLVMIDRRGQVEMEDIGNVRIGGRDLMEARTTIESAVRAAGHPAGRLHVHIVSVDNVKLITVDGNVARPGIYRFMDGMRVRDIVATAGGRGPGMSRAVYITQNGERRFHTSESAANGQELEAGDIVTLSSDL